MPNVPIDSSFASSPLIFKGKVVSQHEDVFFYERAEYSLITNLQVLQDYRGARDKEIVSIIGGLGCNFFFEDGEVYVVFAYQIEPGLYTTSICSPTSLISRMDPQEQLAIEELSMTYYDEFNLTYRLWADRKVNRITKTEPERKLELAYHAEKRRTKNFMYAFTVSLIIIVCLGALYLRKRAA